MAACAVFLRLFLKISLPVVLVFSLLGFFFPDALGRGKILYNYVGNKFCKFFFSVFERWRRGVLISRTLKEGVFNKERTRLSAAIVLDLITAFPRKAYIRLCLRVCVCFTKTRSTFQSICVFQKLKAMLG